MKSLHSDSPQKTKNIQDIINNYDVKIFQNKSKIDNFLLYQQQCEYHMIQEIQDLEFEIQKTTFELN